MNKLIIMLATIMAITGFSPVQKNRRILFFGDSITEQGLQPSGFISLLRKMAPAKKDTGYDLIGAGVSGNKIYDLYLRLENDVLDKHPDVVVIWIGVNDVWHKSSFGTGTDADKFEVFYQAIIKKLKERNIQIIICTPAVIGERTDFSNAQDGDLNLYSNMIRNIANKENCGLADFRQLFHEELLLRNKRNESKGILTADGVHLNAAGNELVAKELARKIFNLP